MSSFETRPPATRFDDLRTEAAEIRQALAEDRLEGLDAALAAELLWTSTLLYARLALEGDHVFPAVPATAALTPTDVVVTASALLRAADLNSFDLAMWFSRASSIQARSPEGTTDQSR